MATQPIGKAAADQGFVERRKWYYVPNKSLTGFNPITFGEEACLPLHFRGVSVCDYWILHYVVSDAAYAVGYNDVVSFSRMFKKFYGRSGADCKK